MISNSIKPLVSIIVPTHNTPFSFFRDCLESIQSQDYKELEVIVVDNDSDPALSEQYKSLVKSLNFQYYFLKEKGVSNARNIGLDFATGLYFTFLDSDDCLGSNYVSSLVNLAETNHLDLVNCCCVKANRYNSSINYRKNKKRFCTIKANDYIKKMLYVRNPFSSCELNAVWGCLYLRSAFSTYRFDKELCVGEDFIYKLNALLDRPIRIGITNDILYFYRLSPGSTMKKLFPESAVYTIERLDQMIKSSRFTNAQLLKAAKTRIVNLSFVIGKGIDDQSCLNYLKECVRHYKADAFFNANTRFKVKMACLIKYDWIVK